MGMTATNPGATPPPSACKILIAGAFAVGKTTFVASASEISPLTTEAVMTAASVGIDPIAAAPGKRATTVAMDFGRITIERGLLLYLFGTPGQDRFWFMWDELARGAIGAVVLADVRRLDGCFPALDYFDQRRLPYLVLINVFEPLTCSVADIRDALALPAWVPLVACDVRQRADARAVLVALVEHVLSRRRTPASPSFTI